MADWENILWALLLGAMVVLLIPKTREIFQQSRKAEPGDWQAVILPILLVLGFVALLISLVR